MIIELRELKCPLCKGKDLEKLGEDKYRCRFCGLSFKVVDIDEEGKLMVDISATNIDYNNVASYRGATTLITCPHCGREIYLWFRTLELDPYRIDMAVIKGDPRVLEKVKIPPEDEEDKH